MRRSPQALLQLLPLPLLVALSLAAAPALAQENPYGLGSPEISDNPNVDETFIGGGDGGSPWPFARILPRRATTGSTQASAPETPVQVSVAPLPGRLGSIVLLTRESDPFPTSVLWVPVPVRWVPPGAVDLR